ncbi:hypothetical protein SVI_3997 [Shewanella violacea DSS12]|uniref:Uncharacterized protein n=1 Tax=Shewanella violacea (strain JCM 10179 / CIP 106290 / LMG 19151 / DSS12) TaxID=637905 RepID=D4ZDQ7_SHEVD|nr:hypothetical protein SVI_3997 [Shewanella violacea DSS12]
MSLTLKKQAKGSGYCRFYRLVKPAGPELEFKFS